MKMKKAYGQISQPQHQVVVAAAHEGSEEAASAGGSAMSMEMPGSDLHHNTSLSSWLMKDDIDDGLAADFDGSLSGLGVEMGTASYNMSEALLALPAVFKHEGEDHGFQYVMMAPTSPATKMNEETLTYLNQGQSYEVKLKKLETTPVPPIKSTTTSGFLRSVVRVVFHERRLQFMEREQLETWKKTHPGERIVDIDIPLSYGLYDVNVEARKLNSIEIVWDPSKDAAVFIKVHCFSTEFTTGKHGGEKGVPFRVQVETYAHSDPSNRLLHCASCQVKVFKPKGADRKNKTDREKVEKKPDNEREKYQPSYACTVLTEIPLEQVESYLEQLRKQEEEDEEAERRRRQKDRDISSFQCISDNSNSVNSMTISDNSSSVDNVSLPFALASPMESSDGNSTEKRRNSAVKIKTEAGTKSLTRNKSSSSSLSREPRMKGVRKVSTDGSIHKSSPASKKSPKLSSSSSSGGSSSVSKPPVTSLNHSSHHRQSAVATLQPSSSDQTGEEVGPLTVDATAEQVADWLHTNRFSSFVTLFQNFSGADLLKLSRDDLIQICGLADGIRLNNSLQHKQIRPKLTIYVCQPSKPKARGTSESSSNPSNVLDIGQIHISSQPPPPSSHPPPSSTACDTRTLAAAIKYSAKQLEEFNVVGFELSNSNPFSLASSDLGSESGTPGASQLKMFNFSGAGGLRKDGGRMATPQRRLNKPGTAGGGESTGTAGSQGLPPSFTIPQTEMKTHGDMGNRSPSNSPSPPNGLSPARPPFQVGAGGDQKPLGEKDNSGTAAAVTVTTAKRQFQDDNSSDSTEYFTKKARTRHLELKRKDIYHAVYLDELSVGELREHLCRLLSVPTACVGEILLQQQSGIHVLVTDHVVHNLPEAARYTITGTQDDSVESICYKVELIHVD